MNHGPKIDRPFARARLQVRRPLIESRSTPSWRKRSFELAQERVIQSTPWIRRIVTTSRAVFNTPVILSAICESIPDFLSLQPIIRALNRKGREAVNRYCSDGAIKTIPLSGQKTLLPYFAHTEKGLMPDIDVDVCEKNFVQEETPGELSKLPPPVKGVIVAKNEGLAQLANITDLHLKELQSLRNHLRAIRIKCTLHSSTLTAETESLVKFDSKLNPSKEKNAIAIRIIATANSLQDFLALKLEEPLSSSITELTLTEKALQNHNIWIDSKNYVAFQAQLNRLTRLEKLTIRRIGIGDEGLTLTLPASLKQVVLDNLVATIHFAPRSRCTYLSANRVCQNASIEFPHNLKLFESERIYCKKFPRSLPNLTIRQHIGTVDATASRGVSSIATELQVRSINGSVTFLPDSQCKKVSIESLRGTIAIPKSVKQLIVHTLETEGFSFEPDSSCETFSASTLDSSPSFFLIPDSIRNIEILDQLRCFLIFSHRTQCESIHIKKLEKTFKAPQSAKKIIIDEFDTGGEISVDLYRNSALESFTLNDISYDNQALNDLLNNRISINSVRIFNQRQR